MAEICKGKESYSQRHLQSTGLTADAVQLMIDTAIAAIVHPTITESTQQGTRNGTTSDYVSEQSLRGTITVDSDNVISGRPDLYRGELTGSTVTGIQAGQYAAGSANALDGNDAGRGLVGNGNTGTGYAVLRSGERTNCTFSGYLSGGGSAATQILLPVPTAADPATNYITISGHGITSSQASLFFGVNNLGISLASYQAVNVIDANTVEVISGFGASDVSGMPQPIRQKPLTNAGGFGYDAEPLNNNHIMLGNGGVTAITTEGIYCKRMANGSWYALDDNITGTGGAATWTLIPDIDTF